MSVKQLFDLTGKTALITGGLRGLGLQIAETLGGMGAKLALVARKQDELDEAVQHLQAQEVSAFAYACDPSSAEAVEPLADRVAGALGGIDVLICDAGATWGSPTAEPPLPAWLKVVGLNLTAPFLLAQAVAR